MPSEARGHVTYGPKAEPQESFADVVRDLRSEALVPLGDYADRLEAAHARSLQEVEKVADEIAMRDDGRPVTHQLIWDCRCWAKRLRSIAREGEK